MNVKPPITRRGGNRVGLLRRPLPSMLDWPVGLSRFQDADGRDLGDKEDPASSRDIYG